MLEVLFEIGQCGIAGGIMAMVLTASAVGTVSMGIAAVLSLAFDKIEQYSNQH